MSELLGKLRDSQKTIWGQICETFAVLGADEQEIAQCIRRKAAESLRLWQVLPLRNIGAGIQTFNPQIGEIQARLISRSRC